MGKWQTAMILSILLHWVIFFHCQPTTDGGGGMVFVSSQTCWGGIRKKEPMSECAFLIEKYKKILKFFRGQ